MRSFALPVLGVLALLSAGACARPLASVALDAGVAAATEEDWEAAVRHWRAALERDPRSAAAHNNLAVAYEKQGAWDDARREYEAALGLDPDNRMIRVNYESFKRRRGSGGGRPG